MRHGGFKRPEPNLDEVQAIIRPSAIGAIVTTKIDEDCKLTKQHYWVVPTDDYFQYSGERDKKGMPHGRVSERCCD